MKNHTEHRFSINELDLALLSCSPTNEEDQRIENLQTWLNSYEPWNVSTFHVTDVQFDEPDKHRCIKYYLYIIVELINTFRSTADKKKC